MQSFTSSTRVMSPTWHPATRIAFRFTFVLMAFSYLPWPFEFPLPVWALGYNWWRARFMSWGRDNLLPLSLPSWDINILLACLLAGIVAGIWTLADRRRVAYPRLHEWMRFVIRLNLAAYMIMYGLFKFIPQGNQATFPALETLIQPLGSRLLVNSLPFALLSISPSTYAVWSGGAEMIGGLLLCFRRTTTLGALFTFGAIAHVFAYLAGDGLVHFQALRFLVPSAILLAPEAKRLTDLFWFHRATEPRPWVSLLGHRWANRLIRGLGAAYLGYVSWSQTLGVLETRTQWLALPPLWGVYEVETFKRGREVVPPLTSDSGRWRGIVIGAGTRGGSVTVRWMPGTTRTYDVVADTVMGTLVFQSRRPGRFGADGKYLPSFAFDTVARLSYQRLDTTTILLAGMSGADSIQVRLRRLDERRFPLVRDSWPWDRHVLNARFADH